MTSPDHAVTPRERGLLLRDITCIPPGAQKGPEKRRELPAERLLLGSWRGWCPMSLWEGWLAQEKFQPEAGPDMITD